MKTAAMLVLSVWLTTGAALAQNSRPRTVEAIQESADWVYYGRDQQGTLYYSNGNGSYVGLFVKANGDFAPPRDVSITDIPAGSKGGSEPGKVFDQSDWELQAEYASSPNFAGGKYYKDAQGRYYYVPGDTLAPVRVHAEEVRRALRHGATRPPTTGKQPEKTKGESSGSSGRSKGGGWRPSDPTGTPGGPKGADQSQSKGGGSSDRSDSEKSGSAPTGERSKEKSGSSNAGGSKSQSGSSSSSSKSTSSTKK